MCAPVHQIQFFRYACPSPAVLPYFLVALSRPFFLMTKLAISWSIARHIAALQAVRGHMVVSLDLPTTDGSQATHLEPINTPLPIARHTPTILNVVFALSPSASPAACELALALADTVELGEAEVDMSADFVWLLLLLCQH